MKAPLASPALTGTPTAPTAAVGTSTTQLATTEFVQIANPTGAVIAFAGSSAPSGWLLCSGQEVAIASYGTLYAVVGTTYGSLTNGSNGVGTTHFRVPDLRGRSIAGVDNMGGTAASRLTSTVLTASNTLGATGGTQTHVLTEAQLASHTHTQNSHNHTQDSHNHTQNAHQHAFIAKWGGSAGVGVNMSAPSYGDPYGLDTSYIAAAAGTNNANTATNQAATATNQSTGSGTAHLNTQPTIVLNYIIKA